MTTIIGIKLTNRIENATEVQNLLTKYGCCIKTRIGLHESNHGQCSPCGIILIEIPDDTKSAQIANELCNIPDVELQQMRF